MRTGLLGGWEGNWAGGQLGPQLWLWFWLRLQRELPAAVSSPQEILNYISRKEFEPLLRVDQLNLEREKHKVFLRFSECGPGRSARARALMISLGVQGPDPCLFPAFPR